jgi:hypothetical protein
MENKELETWLAETKAKNLSRKELFDYANNNDTLSINLFYKLRDSLNANDLIQTVDKLFNQWQKETEFSPKRGDRVLVWNSNSSGAIERNYFDKTDKSILALDRQEYQDFLDNKDFVLEQYNNMKPLPTEHATETDFKSKVIELIEGKINATTAALETIIRIQKDLLEQVKNIC